MVRLIGFFVLVGLIVFAALQLAGNPGEVSIEWLGYRIDTYFGVALLVLLAGVILLLVVYRFIRGLLGLPGGFFQRRAARRRDEGVSALSLGMAAIAAGDAEEARKQAKRAEKLLNDPTKTRLLSAQAAALGGDTEAAGRYFDALTESPETKFVGLVGKLRQALEAGDKEAALPLARQARNLRPDSNFAARSLFALETEAEDWGAAQKTLFDAVRRELIPEAEAKRYRIAIDMERARVKRETGDFGGANDFALRVLKVDPGFAPAVAIAADWESSKGHTRKAQKLIEDAWQAEPQPALAKLYAGLWPDDSPSDRLKHIHKLTATASDCPAGRIALAEAAIAAELWGEARTALEGIPAGKRTAAVYRLLAYLAQAELADAAEARLLLEQAGNAPADPTWTCSDCGATASSWSVRCGHCGHFATLSWKQPPRVAPMPPLPEPQRSLGGGAEKATPAKARKEAAIAEAAKPGAAKPAEPKVEPPEPAAEAAGGKPEEAPVPTPEDVVRRLA